MGQILELSDGFVLMPEGRQTLKIVSAEGKPKVKPTVIETVFVNADGIKLKNKYPLDPKNPGFFVTSILIRCCLDPNAKTFDTDDISKLVGTFVDVEVIHTEGEGKDKDGNPNGKKVMFANIKQLIGKGTSFTEKVESQHEESSRPRL